MDSDSGVGRDVAAVRGSRNQQGDGTMSRKNARKPLVNKPTNQLIRRMEKLHRRENAVTRGWVMGLVEIMRRGFMGRMRWLLKGV
jgi:hypothetical protein